MTTGATTKWSVPTGVAAIVGQQRTPIEVEERGVKKDAGTASIYFVGPYNPIMCGIADYTSFLTRNSPDGRWGVLSFDLDRYGVPLKSDREVTGCVWYDIPDRRSFSAPVIQEGLRELGVEKKHSVLWFQHEFGIWPGIVKFAAMLKNLDMPKVVTFHTLHYQSLETPTGLRREQYDLLRMLLPYVDAITVFSHGVYHAVTSAFPEYRDKVFIIKHGIHAYPEITRLSRREAKEKLNDFLLYDSGLDQETKEALHKQRIFLDSDTVIIGQPGFLCPAKGSELLYPVTGCLQRAIPHKKIVAVRIGSPRDKIQQIYAGKLRGKTNNRDEFLLETWVPQNMLPVAQRAFDVNFYWPRECTQSGVQAHAIGVGAIVAGRDLEGVGETLKAAGELADTSLRHLMVKMHDLILKRELSERIEETVLNYAAKFCWENQVRSHYELAERILAPTPVWSTPSLPLTVYSNTYPTN